MTFRNTVTAYTRVFIARGMGCCLARHDIGEMTCVLAWRTVTRRVLREVCGHKGQEATGDWRELHVEELSDLCVCASVPLYGRTAARLCAYTFVRLCVCTSVRFYGCASVRLYSSQFVITAIQ